MLLPGIRSKKKKNKRYITGFGGINRLGTASMGEIEDSKNVSFDSFPGISAGRKKTELTLLDKTYDYLTTEHALVGYKYSGGSLEIGCKSGVNGAIGTFSGASYGERYAASLGNKIVVFPDKLVCDIKSGAVFSKIEKSFSGNAPTMFGFEDNFGTIRFKNQTSYTTFKNTFEAGDAIKIGYDTTAVIRGFDDANKKIFFDPYTFSKYSDGYFAGEFRKAVPGLKFPTAYCFRVWGCDSDGKIYASKYNDPTNYEFFDLGASDSYTLETETEGAFTGSYPMEDHIVFFKERKIHRISGTKPSNFRHTVLDGMGVKSGAEKTLASKNGVLYYMGLDGVYAYSGDYPRKISEELGAIAYNSGAAVFVGDVYYISIKSGTTSRLYGYDTKRGMWLSDSETEFKNAFLFKGEPYFKAADGTMKTISGEKNTGEEISVTLRDFYEVQGEDKGFARLYIGARLFPGGYIRAEVDYGFGFEPAGVFTDNRKEAFEIRLKPNRGSRLRLRLAAEGKTVIDRIMREHYYHGL